MADFHRISGENIHPDMSNSEPVSGLGRNDIPDGILGGGYLDGGACSGSDTTFGLGNFQCH